MFVHIVGLLYRLILVRELEIICVFLYKYTYEIYVFTIYIEVNKYYGYGLWLTKLKV